MRVCKRIHYAGHVQGVGFRHTTRRLAQGFPLSGFVRNLSDGRVELVVEGDQAHVEALLERIADTMAGYIADHSMEELPVQGFQEFVIRA